MTRKKYRQQPSDVAFHSSDRHLGFLANVDVTQRGTIKKFDPENMGIVVGILLSCAL